ncbi:hypothetical protein MC885_000645 [Smutsia gigantea]|nr:hypothetical protein MC885_000645 [Smutsia gigantea]
MLWVFWASWDGGVLSLTDSTIKAASWEHRPPTARKGCGDSPGVQPLASLCPEVPLRHQQWSAAVSREDCVPAGKWRDPSARRKGMQLGRSWAVWSFLLGKRLKYLLTPREPNRWAVEREGATPYGSRVTMNGALLKPTHIVVETMM